MEKETNKYVLHLGIAEKGKMYAVQGNHKEALRHYKEAIKMTQGKEMGEMFFQHYMQCALESFELMEAYDEVLNYCEKFLELLDSKEESDFISKYKAETWQRMAIQYLHKDDPETAHEYFMKIAKEAGKYKLKISETLLNWLNRKYKITKKQIFDLQNENQYFIVNKNNLKPDIAIELPAAIQ
jgi:tetratricopeptide (TPR) repeat protein